MGGKPRLYSPSLICYTDKPDHEKMLRRGSSGNGVKSDKKIRATFRWIGHFVSVPIRIPSLEWTIDNEFSSFQFRFHTSISLLFSMNSCAMLGKTDYFWCQ